MKFLLPILVCAFAAVAIVALGNTRQFTASTAAAEPTPSPTIDPSERSYTTTQAVPDEVAYFLLFNEVQDLQQRDAESQSRGEVTKFKNTFYSKTLGLNASQAASIDSIGSTCFTQLQPVEQRANEVITQYRAQFPYGKVPRSTTATRKITGSPMASLPAPPSELVQLQAQKDQIILNARQSLQTALGATEFSRFEAVMKKNLERVLLPIHNRSNTPLMTPTPNN